MTTAREAWNLLPHGLNTRVPYSDLPESDKDRFDRWFARIESRIAAEKDAEIARLERFEVAFNEWSDKTDWVQEKNDWEFPTLGMHRADVMRKEILRLESELGKMDAEITQLKARIAELERTATPGQPKPRKTAGEKLCDSIARHTGCDYRWEDRSDRNKLQLEAAAAELGLTDDPEPPSDGELLEQAWLHSRSDNGRCVTHDWDASAAEFRRSLAERDGVQHENA